MDPAPPASEPGIALPLGWTLFAFVVAVLACAGVGGSAYQSESAGVLATSVAALPVGFAVTGAIGAVAIHFLVKPPSLLRPLFPLGCGCLGAVVVGLGTFVFFAGVFPNL